MPRETMTAQERWLAVLHREKPNRIPMDYWATAEASEKLVKRLGVADLAEALARLRVDQPLGLSARYVGPELRDNRDVWGIAHKRVVYDSGAYSEAVTSPLADYGAPEEIEAHYRWPSPD